MSIAAPVFSWDPYDPAITADPYPTYRELLEHAPVARSERHDFWTLCRFDDVQAAARDWRTFSNAEGVDLDYAAALMYGPGDFLDADPPRHDQLRSLVQSAFTPKAIAQLEGRIRSLAWTLVDVMIEQGEADVVEELALPLPTALVCDFLGIPEEDRGVVSELTARSFDRVASSPDIPAGALRAAHELRQYYTQLARVRRERPGDDLISVMVTGCAGDRRLLDAEVEGMCLILYAAGMGTTLGLIANAIYLLATYPGQRAAIHDDPGLLPRAVEEILRYESPVQNSARTTTTDVELHGLTIPAGARVALLFGAANRDPREWDDPDRFDVTREPKRNLAFGDGIHFCVGAPLARLEARIALETLLERAPEFELVGEPERVPSPSSRDFASLHVRF